MKLLGAAGLGVCLACSSPPPAPPASAARTCELPGVEVSIVASDSANSAVAGQGRPVQVRVYVLKSDARLKMASFEDVWQHDAATLQADLLKVEESTAYPGKTAVVRIAANPDAHQLAAVALFRQPQGKNWFATFDLLPPAEGKTCPKGPVRMSVWVDRMQIQDGQGHGPEAE